MSRLLINSPVVWSFSLSDQPNWLTICFLYLFIYDLFQGSIYQLHVLCSVVYIIRFFASILEFTIHIIWNEINFSWVGLSTKCKRITTSLLVTFVRLGWLSILLVNCFFRWRSFPKKICSRIVDWFFTGFPR